MTISPLRISTAGLTLFCVAMATTSCDKKDDGPAPVASTPASAAAVSSAAPSTEIDAALLGAFGALPAVMESNDNPITEEKVALGRELYFETRLSLAKDISCNSCHHLDGFGVDGEKTSEGHKKQRGKRNAPSVYNAAGHVAQFWDGRAATVEDQAKGPITNPVEMAMPDEKAVVAELRKAGYEARFKKAFPGDKDPVTMDNLAKAIGAFERKLVTPSRWDKYIGGDKAALTAAEKAGFKKFVDTGCVGCHLGPYVGGKSYQKLGVVKAWPTTDDVGRSEITKQDADKFFFKVPSLRNVKKTAPYFHDGSVATLEEAIRLMAKHQLGRELADADVASIAAFLDTLTGDLPTAYIAPPKPAGSAKPASSAK